MQEWYCIVDEQQQGPMTHDELLLLLEKGTISESSLVWCEGMSDWVPLSQTSETETPPPPLSNQQLTPVRSVEVEKQEYRDIPNYLPWAIAATILCCIVGGIVSIVYSSKANSEKKLGNFDEAQKAADTAKTWLIVSVVIGIAASAIKLVPFLGALVS